MPAQSAAPPVVAAASLRRWLHPKKVTGYELGELAWKRAPGTSLAADRKARPIEPKLESPVRALARSQTGRTEDS